MLIEHQGRRPAIDPTAYVAPTAAVCGDVTIGPRTHVAFGAVIAADGAPVRIGAQCVVRENVVIRSTAEPRHEVVIGDCVFVAAFSALYGCTVEDEAFLATGAKVFHGARIGRQSEVRIDAIVHLGSVLPPSTLVPIKWVAVGDPAQVLSPDRHDEIDSILSGMDFPRVVDGLEGLEGAGADVDMREMSRRVTAGLTAHRDDRVL
jgi:carbonic anhydrase/acetyltransferase-like protein (isoleucine patch superfamily)